MGPVWLVWSICIALLLASIAVFLWFARGDPARGRRRCPRCWYDMAGVDSLTCPECGRTARSERSQRGRRRRRRWAVLALVLLLASAAVFITDPIVRKGWTGAPVAARIVAIPWCDLSNGAFQQPVNEAIEEGLAPWEERLLVARLRVALEQQSPDPTNRTLAAGIAMHAWTQGADMRSLRAALIAAADDADAMAAYSATTAMSGIFMGDASMIPTWTRLLNESPHTLVRANAAGSLGRMEAIDPAAEEAIRAALADPDPEVIVQAAYAAGNARFPGAVRALLPLTGSTDVGVRIAALGGLGRLGSDAAEAVPKLTAALTAPDDPLRGRIAMTLGRIGATARPALPALFAASRDENLAVRANAIRALGLIAEPHDQRAIDAAVSALTSDRTFLQQAALETLLRLQWVPSEQGRASVEQLMSSLDPSLPIWAHAVLHDPSDVNVLLRTMIDLLDAPDTWENVTAAEVLEALGPRAESAISALERYRPESPRLDADLMMQHDAATEALRAIRSNLGQP